MEGEDNDLCKKKILLKYLVLEEKGVILLVLSTFSIHIKEY